jgi:hypothetical protein
MRENTVPAHALMSLRGLKYGDTWRPVWDFLADRHDFPGPLGLDEAVDDVVSKLSEKNAMVPTRVAPTVFELMGDAHQIGLRQDHVAKLAKVVTGDDGQRLQLLEHATNHLKWDTSEFQDWDQVIAENAISRSEYPQVKPVQGLVPASLHHWTKKLAEDGITSVPPIPDAPACTSTGVGGGAVDGGATTVYGRFDIDGDVKDLVYATDPRNWPQCSWFFVSMTEVDKPVPVPPPDDVGSLGYAGDLEELVGLEDLLTVRTGLTSRFFVGDESVGMEFDLTPGTHGDGKVDVDHGYLLAERHPTEPGKLVITSQKTFSFVGLDDLPFSFLCEFGWIDMMRAMAQCRAPGGRQ